MKRLICLVLVALLCLSGVAYAKDTDQEFWEYPQQGLTMSIPLDFKDLKGQFMPYGPLELFGDMDIHIFMLYYLPITAEELAAWNAHDDDAASASEDDASEYLIPYITLFAVGNSGEGSMLHMLLGDGVEDALELVAETDEYSYYRLLVSDVEHLKDPEYDAEFAALQDRVGEVLSLWDFYTPSDPYQQIVGTKLSFETTDLDGNPVDSEALFGRHEYTLLNLWATWCEHCVGELTELNALNDRLAELDCGVVGLLTDSARESKVEKAKRLMADNGAAYPCIKAPEGLNDMLRTDDGLPTTYFIDRSGTVVGAPIVGAYVDQYEARINELTEGKTVDAQAKAVDERPAYAVRVVDQNGDPVPGASVIFCSDSECVPEKTDENGVAVFHGEAGRYHIQVVDAPDEYDYPDESDDYIGPESGEVTLTITKE